MQLYENQTRKQAISDPDRTAKYNIALYVEFIDYLLALIQSNTNTFGILSGSAEI